MARFEGTSEDDRIRVKKDHRSNIYGLDGNDVLFGGSQSDRLFGGSGDDRLYGGASGDKLVGGPGADKFVFTGVTDIPGSDGDVILDFEQEHDKLVFGGAFRTAGTLHFIEDSAFSGVAGEVRYDINDSSSVIQIDMDGDKITDAVVYFAGVFHFNVSDFSF